jgi:hypothetical protein
MVHRVEEKAKEHVPEWGFPDYFAVHLESRRAVPFCIVHLRKAFLERGSILLISGNRLGDTRRRSRSEAHISMIDQLAGITQFRRQKPYEVARSGRSRMRFVAGLIRRDGFHDFYENRRFRLDALLVVFAGCLHNALSS